MFVAIIEWILLLKSEAWYLLGLEKSKPWSLQILLLPDSLVFFLLRPGRLWMLDFSTCPAHLVNFSVFSVFSSSRHSSLVSSDWSSSSQTLFICFHPLSSYFQFLLQFQSWNLVLFYIFQDSCKMSHRLIVNDILSTVILKALSGTFLLWILFESVSVMFLLVLSCIILSFNTP